MVFSFISEDCQSECKTALVQCQKNEIETFGFKSNCHKYDLVNDLCNCDKIKGESQPKK